MSHQCDTPHKAFAVAAAVVAITASLVAVGDTNDKRGRGSHRAASEHTGRTLVGRARARPSARQRAEAISLARATRIARRFAAAWQPWDTGRRAPHDAATLQRLSVPALWQRLRQQLARPTASHPPGSRSFESVRAIASGRGIWRAPLSGRDPPHSYLGTLVIVTTSAGPRVAAVER